MSNDACGRSEFAQDSKFRHKDATSADTEQAHSDCEEASLSLFRICTVIQVFDEKASVQLTR